MKWFLKYNSMIFYFHSLLVIGILALGDYALFANIIKLYDSYVVIIVLAFFCGIGVLVSLNTVVHLVERTRKHILVGKIQIEEIIQLIVVMFSGTLIGIPGIISSLLGWVIYFKPVRVLIVFLLKKYRHYWFIPIYSYFLAEYSKNSIQKKNEGAQG